MDIFKHKFKDEDLTLETASPKSLCFEIFSESALYTGIELSDKDVIAMAKYLRLSAEDLEDK